MKRVTNGMGWGALAVVVAALGVWLGSARAGTGGESAARETASLPRVRVAEVTSHPLQSTWEGHGLVTAADRATLGFTLGARLRARPVDLGDRVRKGQVLARLDARAYDHQQRAAQADLERAETQRAQSRLDVQRLGKLTAAGAAPDEHLERAETALRAATAGEEAARVQLDEARRALNETVLRAPFDGVVEAVLLEPGEMAAPGQPVVVLSGSGRREVELEVPIDTARRMRPGIEASVWLPLSDAPQELAATITSVGASSRGRAGLLPITVTLEPSVGAVAAVAGAAARVRIPVSRPPRTSVPVASVFDPSGTEPSVLRVRDGKVERVPVRIGSLVSERVTVQSELAAGDRVIVSGRGSLQDGDAVQVTP